MMASGGIATPFLLALSALIFAGCKGPARPSVDTRTALADSLTMQPMIVSDRPPHLEVARPDEIAQVARAAGRVERDRLLARRSTRLTQAGALAYLAGAPAGRRFLALAPHRALARGTPADHCPAIGLGGPAPSRSAAAETALSACLAGIAGREGCACRVIALDDIATERRDAFAYATGVTARLRLPGDGIDKLLVAEEEADGTVLLRGLDGAAARIARDGDRVRVTLADGRVFLGESRPVGFRRGRLAERVYARDAAGARLILLIGFPPEELARSAGAWLAWPGSG